MCRRVTIGKPLLILLSCRVYIPALYVSPLLSVPVLSKLCLIGIEQGAQDAPRH